MKKSKTLLHIVFSVTSLSLLLIGCGVDSGGVSNIQQGTSNSATLSWDAPTTNADETPLNDLAGFKVYYGTEFGNYTETIDVGGAICQDIEGKTGCTYTVESLDLGEYFFSVTAYDTVGNESDFSNEVTKIIN